MWSHELSALHNRTIHAKNYFISELYTGICVHEIQNSQNFVTNTFKVATRLPQSLTINNMSSVG